MQRTLTVQELMEKNRAILEQLQQLDTYQRQLQEQHDRYRERALRAQQLAYNLQALKKLP